MVTEAGSEERLRRAVGSWARDRFDPPMQYAGRELRAGVSVDHDEEGDSYTTVAELYLDPSSRGSQVRLASAHGSEDSPEVSTEMYTQLESELVRQGFKARSVAAPRRRDNRRFQSRGGFGGGGTYPCRSCKKMTRETGQGESDAQLCRNCNAVGLTENTHSDEGHPAADADCEDCQRNFPRNGGLGNYREARNR